MFYYLIGAGIGFVFGIAVANSEQERSLKTELKNLRKEYLKIKAYSDFQREILENNNLVIHPFEEDDDEAMWS